MKAPREAVEAIVNMRKCREQKAKLDERMKYYTKQLAKMMKTFMDDEFEVQNEDGLLSAKLVNAVTITYLKEALKEKIGKQTFASISDKVYSVDEGALQDLLEEHPNLRKVLKGVILVDYVVNEEKLSSAIREGSVSMDDVKECSEMHRRVSIRISQRKG